MWDWEWVTQCKLIQLQEHEHAQNDIKTYS